VCPPLFNEALTFLGFGCFFVSAQAPNNCDFFKKKIMIVNYVYLDIPDTQIVQAK